MSAKSVDSWCAADGFGCGVSAVLAHPVATKMHRPATTHNVFNKDFSPYFGLVVLRPYPCAPGAPPNPDIALRLPQLLQSPQLAPMH